MLVIDDVRAEVDRLPWRAPAAGFGGGFLLALLPATFVMRAFGAGAATAFFGLGIALGCGLATAVCYAVKPDD